jgi:hypothetical protein
MTDATQRLNRLRGGPVHAVDGDIGRIADFYFDDDTWTVRYLVADTGKWLQGRLVLIPLWALLAPDWDQARVPVRLSREQVKRSPDVETRRPVSRREEARTLRHYGYPFYWGGTALWGPAPAPMMYPQLPSPAAPPVEEDDRDTHLRSCREVTGYHIRARDGDIGHVDDFVIDPETWGIRHLLIDTSNWIGGRAVLIEPASVRRVSWVDRVVDVSQSREAIARAPQPDRVR